MNGRGLANGALVAALATSAVACAHGLAAPPPSSPPPSSPSRLLGAQLPSFRRSTLHGERFDTAGTSGRVLVVDFFAAYCGPCRRLLPDLQALHRRRPELAIVGVSLDERVADAARLVARHGLTFPVVHDSGAVLAGRFRVTELPASFVVDRAGRVTWVGGAEQPAGALASAVERALAPADEVVARR